MVYSEILSALPGLHMKPPHLPSWVDAETFPPPPERGYDFFFHVGGAGRGGLRMEIIGHKFGYNMKDASGSFCAVVPPGSIGKNINNNRGPGTAAAGPSGGQANLYSGGGFNQNLGGGFGSMGMGYNNERLGYNPAVHDPQPGLSGEGSVRPIRGFGAAYEAFPDEMATDIDVTRLVADLRASGVVVSVHSSPKLRAIQTSDAFLQQSIYTSMDAGHHLADFAYYCSLAESKRTSKSIHPFLASGPYIAPSPHYGPTYGPQAFQMQAYHAISAPAQDSTSSNAKATNNQGPPHINGHHKPATVLLMHCPPVNEPLSTEEVTDTIKRIIIWVGRHLELWDIREAAARDLPDENGAPGY